MNEEWKWESPEDVNRLLRFTRRFRTVLAKNHGEKRHPSAPVSILPQSFSLWCTTFLPDHFSKSPSLMHRWMLRYLEKMSDRRGEKVNILAPRGGAKSTIGTLAYPLRQALENRESYIWIVSDTFDQAKMHLENIRQAIVGNTQLLQAYPFATGRGTHYRSGLLELKNGVRLEAFGTGQKIRGRRHGASRPSLIICDDLQNDSHCHSSSMRAKSREWFFGTLLKAGNTRTNIIHLATALHQEALAMELTHTPGWKSRVFKAILRYPKQMFWWEKWEQIWRESGELAAKKFYHEHRKQMDEGAAVLWEAEEDLYTLMRMRAEAGHASFEREKQNSPIHPEMCEWAEHYFETERFWVENRLSKPTIRVMALDPSKGKEATRGDFSAYVMLEMDADGDFYVDAELVRCPVEELVELGVQLYQTFQPDIFGVEGNQFQDLLADIFAEKFRKSRLPPIRPWLIHNRVSKEIRIRRIGPYLASGKLHFQANSPGVRLLVEQLRQFPAGDHDDGPDALEMALRLVAKQLGEQTFEDGLGKNLLPPGQRFHF